MKYFKILPILFCTTVLFFYNCNEDKKAPEQEAVKTVEAEKPTTTEAAKVTPPLKEPAQNASGVWHYTCRLGCPGGAGLTSKCETCGNTLVHNTTYHANTNTNSSPTSAPFANPSTSAATTPPEPAQNAAGVWHYTCAKGHAGGAGSAVACGTCGETLAHNKSYH
ncbi:hypothetical protein WNY78_16365 [Psychroserpens sp. AS72]|uniref:hypothetical protein n=1 Tax=Psychroserpens sp. AS72 TaxID=3135775 RepID=UPI003179FA21